MSCLIRCMLEINKPVRYDYTGLEGGMLLNTV
jgi:hypothetical protein